MAKAAKKASTVAAKKTPEAGVTLAERIAFIRKQRSVTLDALAERSGLTKSYLSKVERGLSVPSISAAMKIAESLSLSVGQLLGETQYEGAISIVRQNERRSFMRAGSGSGYDYEMLAPGKQFKTMEPYIMRPPLKFQGDQRFNHSGQEIIFVLAGEMEIEYGGTSYTLGKGDCAYFDAHVPHRSRSSNGRLAEALIVVMTQQR
ncbi:MAG: cupin domain-containing protein [Bradyrhizobiaceae bacterium]|nr:MAG: cupin domain-containing protein [Bradyrhizobiaceae bacterium]